MNTIETVHLKYINVIYFPTLSSFLRLHQGVLALLGLGLAIRGFLNSI